ncbi:MAG TPA: hypothetical protein VOA41_18295 [Candidatus Dormibacteraeota bacterium]|nr:hypothetical protein [Candidatus Dormibacteraeota bacterium]
MPPVSVILGLLFLVLPSALYGPQVDHKEDPLDRQIDSFQLHNETFLDAVARVNQLAEVSISIEFILKESGSAPNIQYPRFDSLIKGGSVKEVLDQVCALDGRFTWSSYKNTVNVFPQSSLHAGETYLLNRHLSRLEIKNVSDPAQAIFQTVGLLPPPHEQIAFMQTGGSGFYSKSLSITLTDVTVRQAFDEIAEHLGTGHGWTFSGAKNFRMIRFHASLLPQTSP